MRIITVRNRELGGVQEIKWTSDDVAKILGVIHTYYKGEYKLELKPDHGTVPYIELLNKENNTVGYVHRI